MTNSNPKTPIENDEEFFGDASLEELLSEFLGDSDLVEEMEKFDAKTDEEFLLEDYDTNDVYTAAPLDYCTFDDIDFDDGACRLLYL